MLTASHLVSVGFPMAARHVGPPGGGPPFITIRSQGVALANDTREVWGVFESTDSSHIER